MKNKKLLDIYFLSFVLVFICFYVFFSVNQSSPKVKYSFKNVQENYEKAELLGVDDVKAKQKIITYSLPKEIFKQYNYRRYISGPGTGRKIKMEAYLITSDKTKCYKMKTMYYKEMELIKEAEEDIENYIFKSFYKTKKIKQGEYNLAVYVCDYNLLYITDLKISN